MSFSNANDRCISNGFRNIAIDFTEECNLACDYCYTKNNDKLRKRVLKFKKAKEIIDYWYENGKHLEKREFAVWGGEPLLQWDLVKKVILYLQSIDVDKSIIIGVINNGTLYTKEKAKWLDDHKIQSVISLDGIQKTHDAHRKTLSGSGSWNTIIKNIKNLTIKQRERLLLTTTITPDTAPYLVEIIEFYIKLSIKNVVLIPVYEENWTENDFEILEKQYKKIIPYLNYFNKIKPLYYSVKETKLNYCGACSTSSSWSIDGYNFPCQRFIKHNLNSEERKNQEMCLGYLENGNYISLHKDTKESFITFVDAPPEKCLDCEIYGYSVCNGGCYGVNYDVTNDIKGIVDNQCRIKKINFKINKLYSEYNKDI